MNNENRKGRYRTTVNNPLPKTRHETSADEPVGASGREMLEDGYSVLDRAQLSRFNRERRGLGSAVSDNDGQDDDFGRFGNLT